MIIEEEMNFNWSTKTFRPGLIVMEKGQKYTDFIIQADHDFQRVGSLQQFKDESVGFLFP